MRIATLACVLAVASAGCGGGELAASDAGMSADAPPASSVEGASPDAGAATPFRNDAAPGAAGDPCLPELEKAPAFPGFVEQEVWTTSNSPACGVDDVCLVNHFRGRVTCPYGQDATGRGPDGLAGCLVPGGSDPVRPMYDAGVEPQCADRTAAAVVYCSCRCASAVGETSDGTYCACPDGMTCTQLIASLGLGDTDTSGAYCIKAGTLWDGGSCAASCDPSSSPCP
jgi:hypothetical protein